MMNHVHQVDCVDRPLRDILKVNKPFGGIVTVFGGDPRQILPVVRHGNRPQIVKSCIHSSVLWNLIQQLQLTINMQVIPEEIEFAEYLLTVGNGTATEYQKVGEDMIQIPEQYGTEELIEKVFPEVQYGYPHKYFVSHHAILTPINDNVDKLNETL